MSHTIQPESSRIVAAFLLLAWVGIGYNWLVAWMGRKRYLEGFIWLAVSGGVAFTLIGMAIVDWQAALLALGAFVCSGLPMALGEIWRYMKRREEGQRDVRQAP